ncbi:conserved hypothetical protein [Uncinocarpus reesii 1704]|uniref:GED domain-containing protein n=1 Tax=Uncinocarpus reesii (strain UAMH 1704) TaxID=336963 RepID=C4JWI2_UNCRE|nr:uncharacterized protein UREG_06924 [Uncinocarpus reesii 1704]EEP82059.1 conserved hypothetical protein [Uncinocarpus reesii 1704]
MAITLPDNENSRPGGGHLNTLQSTKVKQRLNQIDRIRAKGIGDHISLPQLVVCGAQSAGKSSVLEGITGIPFPRQDGVCTKFGTEIILRHSLETASINASIIPHITRDEQEAKELRSFQRRLDGYEELPDTIKDAAACMGIRGFGAPGCDGPAFAADVLRIEVTGDIGLHLTVVDLPGLISVDETGGEDVKLVESLVDWYLQSSRTIILAVVQATNDIVIEPIIQRARHFDKSGQRTVGIITKSDLINKGTEGRIALFTKNLDQTKLKLGYFLLKNPSPEELAAGTTALERKRLEMEFFRSERWREHGLNFSRVGIEALRSFLQVLLEDHIERELPKVCNEIDVLLERTQAELHDLGEERLTIGDQRLFLSKLSMDFQGIMQAALEGSYHTHLSGFFSYGAESATPRRLRARFHELNGLFADYMRDKSQKRNIGSPRDPTEDEESGDQGEEVEQVVEEDDSLSIGHPGLDNGLPPCQSVSRGAFDGWVKQVYKRTRGQELPGNYSNILLTELFHEQSSRWPQIAKRHVITVHKETSSCVQLALNHVIKDDHVRHGMLKIVNRRLQQTLDDALAELQKLCSDEKLQPITYNHYYTDNIQKSRQNATKAVIQKALHGASHDVHGVLHISNTESDKLRLLSSLQRHVVVDMDQQACEEAKSGLKSYYKVAMKTFVDNVCRQVVERHIALSARSILTPTGALQLSDDQVKEIASETQSKQERRNELKMLEKCLRECVWELST